MLRFLHRPHLGFYLVVACTAPLYKDTNLTKESDLSGSAPVRFLRLPKRLSSLDVLRESHWRLTDLLSNAVNERRGR